MYCSKCGQQIPDGSVCPCQQSQYPQYQAQPIASEAPILNLGGVFRPIYLLDIVTIVIGFLAFVMQFVDWYSATVSGFGNKESNSFGAFQEDIGEAGGLFGFVKFLLILNIFIFVIFLATKLVDVNKFVNLGNIDLGKIAQLAFFGVFAVALVLGLLACLINGESYFGVKLGYGPSWGWWLTLLFDACGLVITFRPSILSKIIKK